ncbi:hypothetical protein FHW92_004119 [Novosphingobium sp. SG707]|nr:hypothetical protein [Novosphingobium sp. SG707]
MGLAVSPGVITGDTGRMLVTFLGLVSASILPTISLLVNSMTASGRSVLAINELNDELQAGIDALLQIFMYVAIAVAGLLSLSMSPPILFFKVPHLTNDILPRLGQAVVIAFSVITVIKSGTIPAILRRSLAVRHKIAAEEARRKTLEKAPPQSAAQSSFPTHPDFGKVTDLEDVIRRGR